MTDLYTFRTRQVPISEDLKVNLRLMDGNPEPCNYGEKTGRSQLEMAKSTGVTFMKSDGDNIVCASDMYFNSKKKKCTTFPFASNSMPIVYRVVNSV